MYYRVDYNVALLVVGALIAVLASRRLAGLGGARLARGYLWITAVLVAVRVVLFVATAVLGIHAVLPTVSAVLGDAGAVLFGGGLYGVAIAALWRGELADFLRAAETRFALCLGLGVGFALAGIGKAFAMDAMLTFFAQSGYSKNFLYLIMTLEALVGVALVLPWRWVVLAAIAAITIDMVGAIATHVHNGDPLDDSTGAIMSLFRIAPLALMAMPRAWAAVGAAACAVFAFVGAAAMRTPPPPPPAGDDLAYFVGPWQCAGQFAKSGKPVEADVRGELVVGGRWLLLHHDDKPPGKYHALGTWFHDGAQWTATIIDSSGGVRRFRSDGWHGTELTWDHSDTAVSDERFVYHRLDDASFELAYDRLAADAWQRVDTVTCHRS
jgi:hypothetical protein